ncbi:MAG: MMPL family transporter [Planctomycetaceae bacterium]|nr:MMPL family transporter [Planctomycetaceae bacterium]
MSASNQTGASPSFPARLLGRTVTVVAARPRFMLWMMLLVTCGAVGVTYSHLTFRTDRSDLLDPSARFVQNWKDCRSVFGPTADLIITVETDQPNPVLLRNVINDVASRVERSPEAFSNVLYRVNQKALRRKGLQLLNTAELSGASRRLDGYVGVVRNQNWSQISTEGIAQQLQSRVRTADEAGNFNSSAYDYVLRFTSSLNQFSSAVVNGSDPAIIPFQSPLPQLMNVKSAAGTEDNDLAYLINQEGTVGLIQVQPVSDENEIEKNAASIEKLKDLVATVRSDLAKQGTEAKVSVTGIPVLDHDELSASRSDTVRAMLLAAVLVSLLMFAGFRSIRHPMLAFLTLLVALTWTTAAAALTIGHLNIVSISFAVIMIGLGIDFSIHFLTRYLHLRQELYELPEALRLTAEGTGTGIIMSTVTTALAFATAMLTGFPGLAELGMIAAMGILLSCIATFLFLPALIAFTDTGVEVESLPQTLPLNLYRRFVIAWPVAGIALALVVAGGVGMQAVSLDGGTPSLRLSYDSNQMHLHDDSLESVQTQQRLQDSTGESLLFAVSIAGSREEALEKRRQFLSLPSVARVSDIASQLPDPPDAQQRQLIQSMLQQTRSISGISPKLPTNDANRIFGQLQQLLLTLKESKNPQSAQAVVELSEFLSRLKGLTPQARQNILDAYQAKTVGALYRELNQVASASLDPVRAGDLPQELRARYFQSDVDGEHWLLKIHPRQPVWDDGPLAEFVQELRTVDPDIAGIPIRNYESAQLLQSSYCRVAVYSLAAIAVILLFGFLRPGQKFITILPPAAVVGVIGYTMFRRTQSVDVNQLVTIGLVLTGFIAAVLDYRNLRDTLLALLPPVIGGAMMLGVMAILHIDLNPVNLIVLPLVLGVGVDNGIHLVQDCRRQILNGAASEYSPSVECVTGVIVTSLTSIVGFGSLMIASHRGLFSLGIVMALGVAGCLFVCLTLMPPILLLVAHHQPAAMTPLRIRKPKSNAEDDSEQDDTEQARKQTQQKQQRRAA